MVNIRLVNLYVVMSQENHQKPPTFKEKILASVVIISLLGLLTFSLIDINSRPIFLDVAKMTIGIYMGYLIPNQN